jgi:hypothetical protein
VSVGVFWRLRGEAVVDFWPLQRRITHRES